MAAVGGCERTPMNTPWNALLAIASLAVGLAFAEGVLRLFHTGYEYMAEPPRRDYRSVYKFRHPDTGTPHAAVYNNLGGRQHRNFTPQQLAEGVNIAFFGDSFTENLRVPAPYSFTEVLDFLLNAHPDATSRFNVLNFGVADTGPGRQYIRYRTLAARQSLRHVFYVHCFNDMGDTHRAAQWGLWESGQRGADAAGHLVTRLRWETSPWVRALSGLHLTYLALDAYHRVRGVVPGATTANGGDGAAEVGGRFDAETIAVFEAVLQRWRSEVEANGGTFHVVLLPRAKDGVWFERSESLASWEVVDLRACFAEAIPGYRYEDFRFRRDFHWNEAGNMVAAHCLYRQLEPVLGLARQPREALAQSRYAYYQAFQDSSAWEGERFVPASRWALPGSAAPPRQAHRIVARYLAMGAAEAQRVGETLMRARYRAITASAPTVRSVWNIHARRQEGRVAYVKAPCGAEDEVRNIFLRVRPADPRAAGFMRPDGFVDIPLQFDDIGLAMFDGKCLMTVRLPGWRIGTVWTGGRESPHARGWSARFYWDLDGLRSAARRAAVRPPDASGAFAVHHAGSALTYVREPCVAADVRHRFFLHVRGRSGRIANLDFHFGERGAVLDNMCVAVVPFPKPRRGARVYTGQFDQHAADEGRVWEVEFAIGKGP